SAQRPSPPSPLPHALPPRGRGAPPPKTRQNAPFPRMEGESPVPPLPGGCECVWERGLGGEGPQSAGYEDFDATLLPQLSQLPAPRILSQRVPQQALRRARVADQAEGLDGLHVGGGTGVLLDQGAQSRPDLGRPAGQGVEEGQARIRTEAFGEETDLLAERR